MRHSVLEYSANLEGSIDIAAIRTRAARQNDYLIAGLAGDYSFTHHLVRIKEGRSDDEKNELVQVSLMC